MTNRQYDSSQVASIYIEVRPTPSHELINSIIKQLSKHCPPNSNNKWSRAVDVGCGSGQATFKLADYFDQVIGYDISVPQIKEAIERNKFDNVTFKISPGEEIDLEDNSVQLITVCEALHFFNIDKFNSKVDSLLSKNGLFATIGYYPVPKCIRLDDTTVNLDRISNIFERTFQLWQDHGYPVQVFVERVLNKYRGLNLPFDKVCYEDTFVTTLRRPATYLIDLINSLGTSELFRSKYPEKDEILMNGIKKDLHEIFGTNDLSSVEIEASFEYFVICFKK
ncbi:putative methyltransferase DDB_G0268948 [Tetranychus urticae]|uniref:Methyltransferase domain-containing protein n=1 Tax=Tetranychus urticae TaxID=32264 RepID=T1L0M9_TETUR|nr:putative methyltransferase DDB_G0268948 [Tetranychus urticae]